MRQKKVVAGVTVALYAILAFLAIMVTDFHDRSWPQRLGVQSQVSLGFSGSTIDPDLVVEYVSHLSKAHRLDMYKVAPDLNDTGAAVYVSMDSRDRAEVHWFGDQRPAMVLDVERLASSSGDGTYLVRDTTDLPAAVTALRAAGVSVERRDASVLDTIAHLGVQAGVAAPLLAVCLLVAAMTVFWLAVRARSRALRVLAGAAPWRIQAQDVGAFVAVLAISAIGVTLMSSLAVGLLRGWVYVPTFVTALAAFNVVTVAASVAVVVAMSSVAWPNADLFARRTPAVASLRWPARAVQAVTLLALIAFTAPAWAAAQDAGQRARQLAAWNELSDQVALTFGMREEYFDRIADPVSVLVAGAESEGQAALSYTITAERWQGDFGPYSAISIVNPAWVELVEGSLGAGALVPADQRVAGPILRRELGPSLEIWGADSRRGQAAVLAALVAYRPAPGVTFPVVDGGARGRLSFLDDVLVVLAPTIGTVFDPDNTTSLASTGNIILTGVDATTRRLDAAGLDAAGLARRGVEGTLRPLYMAEDGILQAQYATYVARLLSISLATMAVAFVVASAVNATISAILNGRRDFPLRLTGVTAEAVVRARALTDVAGGVVIALGVIAIRARSLEALGVTLAATAFGLAAVYISHAVAVGAVFTRVSQRRM